MALFITTAFEGLSDQDFNAYAPNCWSNNRHNLARMKTKERIVALARHMGTLADDGLVLEASSEIPSVWNNRCVKDQWAYLLRDAEARKTLRPVMDRDLSLATRVKDPAEHHKHVLLYVRIDHETVEFGLRINEHATVDLANLMGHAEADRAALEIALGELPAGISLDDGPVSAGRLLQATRAARAGQSGWVTVARHIPRTETLATDVDLLEAVAEMTTALRPLYRFIAWSPTNDHVNVNKALEDIAANRTAHEAEQAAALDEKRRAHEARREEAQARTSARQADQDAWREMQRKARKRMPPREAQPAAQRPRRDTAKAPEAQPSAQRPQRDTAKAPEARPEVNSPETSDRPTTSPLAEAVRRPAARKPAAREPAARKPAARKPAARKPAARKGAQDGQGMPADVRGGPRSAQLGPTLGPIVNFKVGDRCELSRGLLAGKQGEITAAKDKQGFYKVRVGTLEVGVAAADLRAL